MFFPFFHLSVTVSVKSHPLTVPELSFPKTNPEVGNPTPGLVTGLFYLSELVAVVVGIVGGRLLKFNRVQPTV